MKFREWFEDAAAVKGAARHWRRHLPSNAKINDAAVSQFADQMADPHRNAHAVAADVDRLPVYEVRYDHQPIANNLVAVDEKSLGIALGLVTNQADPKFAFFMGGNDAGNLIIRHPPVFFDDTDRTLLHSIIRHECGHAIDWASHKYGPASGGTAWNPELYARNVHEARQYASQLHYLLRQIGSVDKVMAALQGRRDTQDRVDQLQKQVAASQDPALVKQLQHLSTYGARSPFALHPALLPVARTFLGYFAKGVNESFGKWLAAPLLAASPMTGQPTQPEPAAIVQADQAVHQACEVIEGIVTLLKFGNFVKPT